MPPRLARACAVSALTIAMVGGCVHSARNPRPMPSVPEGACDPGPEGDAETEHDAERNIVPVKRFAPYYPRSAYQNGIQGWACLRFTVAANGTVEGARVLASAPEGYFEEAALTAVRQWWYTPKTRDGQRVARPGVRVMLRFELAPGR